ncbi:hypothetical protein N4G69_48420 [Streptomyces mirabilis]|uniref:hypothetical protein n=1 Tax=Streptomyces mirabilis TaxID=68239 RepID=UPI0021C0F6C2|nr:hypothetical protein [Streptomyces mirabilis]MCT9113260.1 hypothetical protein [Streptomyces mirabilis]
MGDRLVAQEQHTRHKSGTVNIPPAAVSKGHQKYGRWESPVIIARWAGVTRPAALAAAKSGSVHRTALSGAVSSTPCERLPGPCCRSVPAMILRAPYLVLH